MSGRPPRKRCHFGSVCCLRPPAAAKRNAMNTGRRNKVLNMGEKIRLIQGYEDGLSVRQLQEQFQCGKTQIYETLKRRHDIRREYGDVFQPQERNRRVGKFHRHSLEDVVDGVVWTWFADARIKNLSVSASMLKDKAKSAAHKLDLQEFEAGNEWINNFLKRHNVPTTDLMAERALVRPTDLILPTRSPSIEAMDRGDDSSTDQHGPGQEVSDPVVVMPVEEDLNRAATYLDPVSMSGVPCPEDSRYSSPFVESSFPVLTTRSLDDEAHDHFIKFVDSTLRSITPDYRKDLAKLEIQQVLIKYKHSVEVPLGQPSFTTHPSSTTQENS